MSMTNAPDRVEIITSVQRRRRWTASEKVRMVEETFEPGMTVSLVARRHGVAPNQLFTWRRLVAQGGLTAAGSGEEVVPASDYRALQSQVRELQHQWRVLASAWAVPLGSTKPCPWRVVATPSFAGRIAGDMQTQAKGQAKQMRGPAEDLYSGQAKDAAGSITDIVRSTIEERPYTAVAIALGLGWLFGRTHRPL